MSKKASNGGFIMRLEDFKHIQKLTAEQRGILLTAIYLHVSGDELPGMDAVTEMAYSFIVDRIDAERAAYAKKCETLATNAQKGGAATKAKYSQMDAVEGQEKPNGFFDSQIGGNNSINNTNIQGIREEGNKGEGIKGKDKGRREEGCAFSQIENDAQVGSDADDFSFLRRQLARIYDSAKPEEQETMLSVEETFGVLESFFHAYQAYAGEPHPRISAQHLREIVSRLSTCFDENGEMLPLSPALYESIIPRYFSTDFADGCDYRISHFMTDPIRAFRLREVLLE